MCSTSAHMRATRAFTVVRSKTCSKPGESGLKSGNADRSRSSNRSHPFCQATGHNWGTASFHSHGT